MQVLDLNCAPNASLGQAAEVGTKISDAAPRPRENPLSVQMLDERAVWRLALASVHGVGPKAVLKSFQVREESFKAFEEAVGAVLRRTIDLSPFLERAWKTANDAAEDRVRIVPFDDAHYPKRLRWIPDPPPFLYVKGELGDLERAVAVIGTRQPTDLALQATRAVVESLTADPSVRVVSGLALGVDTAAHRAALDFGLVTVAVLAGGLDSIYPRKNAKLADDILERGGVLISEMPVGAKLSPYNLVARDRIQSGLSLATFLMQSSLGGGSMHTAFFTLEQGRTLMVFRAPEGDDDAQWAGNRFLGMRPASIQWERVPERIARFRRFANEPRFAVPMAPGLIPEMIGAGLKTGFALGPKNGDLRQPDNRRVALNLADFGDPNGPASGEEERHSQRERQT